MFEAESFEELFRDRDKEEEARPKNRIENIGQLMLFILNELLDSKERERMRAQVKKEMSVDEKIALFPEVYQNCLRLYREHRNRNKKEEQRELRVLEKTISKPRYYNPDAFIEGVE